MILIIIAFKIITKTNNQVGGSDSSHHPPTTPSTEGSLKVAFHHNNYHCNLYFNHHRNQYFNHHNYYLNHHYKQYSDHHHIHYFNHHHSSSIAIIVKIILITVHQQPHEQKVLYLTPIQVIKGSKQANRWSGLWGGNTKVECLSVIIIVLRVVI